MAYSDGFNSVNRLFTQYNDKKRLQENRRQFDANMLADQQARDQAQANYETTYKATEEARIQAQENHEAEQAALFNYRTKSLNHNTAVLNADIKEKDTARTHDFNVIDANAGVAAKVVSDKTDALTNAQVRHEGFNNYTALGGAGGDILILHNAKTGDVKGYDTEKKEFVMLSPERQQQLQSTIDEYLAVGQAEQPTMNQQKYKKDKITSAARLAALTGGTDAFAITHGTGTESSKYLIDQAKLINSQAKEVEAGEKAAAKRKVDNFKTDYATIDTSIGNVMFTQEGTPPVQINSGQRKKIALDITTFLADKYPNYLDAARTDPQKKAFLSTIANGMAGYMLNNGSSAWMAWNQTKRKSVITSPDNAELMGAIGVLANKVHNQVKRISDPNLKAEYMNRLAGAVGIISQKQMSITLSRLEKDIVAYEKAVAAERKGSK